VYYPRIKDNIGDLVVNSKEKKHATPPEVKVAQGQEADEAPSVDPSDRAEMTEAELEALVDEREKLKDQLLRTAADFDNFRKRSRRDVEDARRRGKEEIVRDLLPVFDSLERAATAAREAKDIESIAEGVHMVLKLFEDATERVGLTRLPTVGERFDPAIHDAVQEMETVEVAPGTILAEVLPGYRFGEHLVRAAVVVVARAPRGAVKSGQQGAARGESQGEYSEEEVS
jgi:molecular chaperone GrpE